MFYIFLSLGLAIGAEVALQRWVSSRAVRARLVESVFALAIGFSAILALSVNGFGEGAASSSFERGILLAALGFFLYHLHRVIYVPGFTKSLILHHVGMILCISVGLIYDKVTFYILLASIPITSAAVRNIRWFWRTSGRPAWYRGAIGAAVAYLAFESIPPVYAVTHFFTIGVHKLALPTYMWIFAVIPGLALALLTFYWSALFVRKTIFEFHERAVL